MNVITQCEQCHGDIEFSDEDLGKQGVCPICSEPTILREPEPDWDATIEKSRDEKIRHLARREKLSQACKILGSALAIGAIVTASGFSPSCVPLGFAALALFGTGRLLRPRILVERDRRAAQRQRQVFGNAKDGMTVCSDCGHEVNARARACPGCGAPGAKSRSLYQVLAFFVGMLGIHNFYAGYHVRGAIQLLLSFAFVGSAPECLIGIIFWVIAECILVTRDGQGRRML